MNRPVVLIFIIAAIALLPMCCVFTGFLGGSNFMAWRVMESIDPNLGADAQKIKSEMSEFLDMHSKETYEEENKEGCVRTWEQLFRLEFCEYDLSGIPIADLGPGDGEGYCPAAGCPAAKTIYDCNSLEDQYGSVPFELDCLDGVLIDSNGNGQHDPDDKARMTTCHPYWDSVGKCCCAYSGSHAGWDQATGDGRMGQAIFTPVSGTVVDVGMTSTGWGYRVTIYNCGMLYTFNHLLPSKMTSSPPVKVGDHVHAGDVVGWMGGGTGNPADDGNSSGAHLDYTSYMCYMGDKYTGEFWRGVGGVSVDSASFGFKNLNYPYDYSEGSCSSGGAAACPELYAGNPGSHLVDAATCSSGRTKCK